jgi:hypothetical protein
MCISNRDDLYADLTFQLRIFFHRGDANIKIKSQAELLTNKYKEQTKGVPSRVITSLKQVNTCSHITYTPNYSSETSSNKTHSTGLL